MNASYAAGILLKRFSHASALIKYHRHVELIEQYLDESGHGNNDDVVVVAGLFGLRQAWHGFDERWNARLHEHGISAPFHMTDFEARQRHFRDFTNERERRSLLAGLIDEIVGRPIYAIGAAVTLDAFRAVNWSDDFPGSDALENVYHMALQDELHFAIRLCSDLNNAAGDGPRFQVSTVLAAHPEFQGMAGAYHRSLAAFDQTRSLVPQPRFDCPATCSALQAADLVAFEWRRHILRPDLNRYPWSRLALSRPAYFHVRGVDATVVLPHMTFRPDGERRLVLKDLRQKRSTNQNKRRR